ncbi:protein of unknown function DUF486 [Pirellula staleyi DSM 6068]|uniref:Transmembrane signal peptide protein n=1 Tax=Pirellula staleyi (strain ATCC 27377 / DSM 6068 / ICPB 4128) TaxID=530564 RepID=D2R2M8_PIRSD|nr:DMT family protein [Pirellula staleyi]ADB16868.1 protein of unknown function DUF486 [Pirellula staleyi DSM 6068]
MGLPPVVQTILLLIASNAFMTYAWYGHLGRKTAEEGAVHASQAPLLIAILTSWGIAFFEYVLQVPANRIGANDAHLSVAQLKIMQEVITLAVFVPFSIYYMNQRLNLDFLWAGLCMCAAVFFVFRSR